MLLAMIRVGSELQASDLLMAPAEIPPRLCVRRVRRDERFADRKRLDIALHRSGRVAEVAGHWTSAHVAHSLISGRQLALQGRVALCFARKAVQVSQSLV